MSDGKTPPSSSGRSHDAFSGLFHLHPGAGGVLGTELYVERRWIPRVSIELGSAVFKWVSLHEETFENPLFFPVGEVSEDGFSIWRIEHFNDLKVPVGSQLSGELQIKHVKFQVQAQLIRLGDLRISFLISESQQMDSNQESFHEFLKKLRNLEILAKHFKLFPSPQLEELWWHAQGIRSVDFFLKPSSHPEDGVECFKRWEFFFDETFVSWSDRGLQTGQAYREAKNAQNLDQLIRLEALQIQADPSLDFEKIALVYDFFKKCPLPENIKTFCLNCFNEVQEQLTHSKF